MVVDYMSNWYKCTVTQKCLQKLFKYLKIHNYSNYHYYFLEPKEDSLIIVEIYAYKTLKKYVKYLEKYSIKVEMI